MSIVFRAGDEPVASRVERLRHEVGDTIAPIDVDPMVSPAEINDQFHAQEAGTVRVVAVSLTPATAARTARLIRRSDPGLCKIDVIAQGSIMVEQDGRQAHLDPGDFSFVDLSRPCRWVNRSAAHGVAVMFPRAVLPLSQDELTEITGTCISGDQSIGGLVSSLALQMPRLLGECAAADGARLGTAVTDLLLAALATRLDRGSAVPHDSRQRALLMRIHAFIEQRLPDPGLSPATIAAAHHISARYLYKLFETQQITVADWIRRRRLERCRRDLLDPRLTARPVSAIAARWGFPNPAHFSRLFRAAYHAPPGEYRALRGMPGQHRERPS